MKEIKLTKGKVAIVDDDVFDYLNQWKWYYLSSGHGYAARRQNIDGIVKVILMHRIIMNTLDNMDIDHINHNGMDNRRCNLRICTRSQNGANRMINKNSKSGMKGVWIENDRKVYRAVINIHGKKIHIGKYNTIEEAARAYDKKSKELFGEFAYNK